MTRNFRDAWEASTHGDDEPVASPDVQDRIASMLREASHDVPRMPSDVEARIRGALAAEFSTSNRQAAPAPQASGQVPGAVPLPARPREEFSSDEDATVVRAPSDISADETRPATVSPYAARPAGGAADRRSTMSERGDAATKISAKSGSAQGGSAPTSGASVSSLDAHRRRRSGMGKAALALGAAAAVAIGAVGAVKMNDKPDAPVAGASSSATPGQDTTNYASRVRVTQTETKYTAAGLATQAAGLRTSKATPIEPAQANAQALGPLATGEGVQACLSAVAKGLVASPDKVYADFATYDGTPAVIVVAVKGKTTTAWVVSRTCSTATDLEAGPTSVTT